MSWLKISSIILALVSAGLWFWSASMKPIYPMAYLSGPPKHIADQIDFIGKLNAWAAATTGLSVLLSAISDMILSC